MTEETTSLMACLPYRKPKERHGPPRYPDPITLIGTISDQTKDETDKAWELLRMLSRRTIELPVFTNKVQQIVPFWTGFYKLLSVHKPDFVAVGYPPIVDAKPTDMATVYTAMQKCLDMTVAAGQSNSIQTFDQQLYAIGQQVKWSMLDSFQSHVLRLGEFHTLSCYISAVGKLWSSAGLRELLVDSGAYAGCTVDQILIGKQFNRGIRAYTLVYEALMTLWLSAFFQWCSEEGHMGSIEENVWQSMLLLHEQFCDPNRNTVDISRFHDLFLEHLSPLVSRFRDVSSQASPTFKFWDMFLHAVEVMLINIRAERDGDWQLHLQSVSSMLPYFFVTNKTNYARWTPVYLLDMLNLPDEVRSAFECGKFAVKQKAGGFNGVWSDMATEKTIIRDSKGTGGIVGLTTQKSALLRWTFTRHILSRYASEMRCRSGVCFDAELEHEESRPTAMKRDEQQVIDLIEYIQNHMTDPFSIEECPKSLINIATGLHASKEVEESLLGSIGRGAKAANSFIHGCFKENETRDFYSPISRSKLKTFEDLTKPCNLKCRSGEVIKAHINPEIVFRRALALANVREEVTVEKVLAYPIGQIPTALFHDDGLMRKSCKSDLINLLEKDVCSAFTLPEYDRSRSVLIRDSMAIIQSMNVKRFKSFGDLAKDYFKVLLACFHSFGCVVDVFDRYDVEQSVKSTERKRRSVGHIGRVFQIIDSRPIPDWKKFLSVPENKTGLIRFLCDYALKHYTGFTLGDNDQIQLAGCFQNPETVMTISSGSIDDVPELFSTQEEADTRIILHALFANKKISYKNSQGRIVIKSSDTDVFLLCLHYFPQMSNIEELWFQTGSVNSMKDARRFVPVHDITLAIGPLVCNILPAVHALTGCDTTSSFVGIGKKTVYKTLIQNPQKFQNLWSLAGSDVETSVEVGRKFVSVLYDPKGAAKSAHDNLNELRVKSALAKDASLVRLPPSEAAFKQHILRVSLQVYVWMNSHVAKPAPISPLKFGWAMADGSMKPVYFEGPMSSEFLQDLICTCKGKNACSKSCICTEQNLACTSICSCQGNEDCKNHLTHRAVPENITVIGTVDEDMM